MKRNHKICLSTAYLPPVSYIYYLYHADEVYLEKKENYQKQTYRNRCRIAGANGILDLIVPVVKTTGNHTLLEETRVCQLESWVNKHWRAIESSYNTSPFFLHYRDDFKNVFSASHTSLFDLNLHLINALMRMIGFEKAIITTSEYQKSISGITDLRRYFSPKKQVDCSFKPYHQVFSDRLGFIPDLSIIDLLFNEGPLALEYIRGGITKK